MKLSIHYAIPRIARGVFATVSLADDLQDLADIHHSIALAPSHRLWYISNTNLAMELALARARESLVCTRVERAPQRDVSFADHGCLLSCA
jgi:hypothetical protein